MSRIIITSLLFLGLSSCSYVYFNSPQPEKVRNRTTIPSRFHGTWILGPDTSLSDWPETCQWDTFFISKQSYLLVESNCKLDSTKLKPGSDNRINPEAILFDQDKNQNTPLSDTLILRKVTNRYYILNSLTRSKNHGDVWTCLLTEYSADGTILFRTINTGEAADIFRITGKEEKSYHKDTSDSYYHSYYLDFGMSRKQMKQFIRSGGFADTLMVLRPENKIR